MRVNKYMLFYSTISLFLLFSNSYANNNKAQREIAGFAYPESVVADADNKYFFVSNVGEKMLPTAKDKDGFISKLSVGGEIIEKKYLPKKGFLNSPKGMAIIKDSLWVADVDKVVGFNLKTKKKIFVLDFSQEKTLFLNDLVVINKNMLMVSATDVGKIYKIFIKDKPYFEVFLEDIPGANGLFFDKQQQKLFIVSFGKTFDGSLGVVDLKEDKIVYQVLAKKIGGLDGVALLNKNKIIFSDWVAADQVGVMRIYDLAVKKLYKLNLIPPIQGPADFFYDQKRQKIWIPKMKENKVLIKKIDMERIK